MEEITKMLEQTGKRAGYMTNDELAKFSAILEEYAYHAKAINLIVRRTTAIVDAINERHGV